MVPDRRTVQRWGCYADTISRWEHITGWLASASVLLNDADGPWPAPAFVEWLMDLPRRLGHWHRRPDAEPADHRARQRRPSSSSLRGSLVDPRAGRQNRRRPVARLGGLPVACGLPKSVEHRNGFRLDRTNVPIQVSTKSLVGAYRLVHAIDLTNSGIELCVEFHPHLRKRRP